jgi:preprotein translocase subunit SecA
MIARVRALGPAVGALADADLPPLTQSLAARHARGEPLDDLLPEAFAAAAEAAARALSLRPFDVQLMGGAALHLGRIVEMRTGEGKTVTATMPAYLHALTGRGVHVMTANDYLAERDAEWMRPAYRLLGLETGLLRPAINPPAADRRPAYAADVTYGPWNEFGNDYLRDNIRWPGDAAVQRGLHSAIADEADFILIDRMRSEQRISAPAENAGDQSWPATCAALAAEFERGEHYKIDAERRTASLTDSGARVVEDRLRLDNLYAGANLSLVHYLETALAVKECYQRGRDYIVSDGRAVPVDRATGRPQASRLGDGVHEAIEAREGLAVGAPTSVLAAIATWDYLAQYERLAGMTGTAQDDATAYRQLYQREVLVVPANRPVLRIDHADVLYRTGTALLAALAAEAARRSTAGQPVLIGVTSAPESAEVSELLTEAGVAHEVLTADNPGQEARIMAGAGRPSMVTVAVQLAGRGVDIVLGGPDGAESAAVAGAGGLCVLGAGRPSRRRAELHLRGRAGRQGDPGESKLFVCIGDDWAQAHFGPVTAAVLRRTTVDGHEQPEVSRSLARAQHRLAAQNAAWLESARAVDQVIADQRSIVYAERAALLDGADVRERARETIDRAVRAQVTEAAGDGLRPDRFWAGLRELYPVSIGPADGAPQPGPVPRAQLPRIAHEAVADAREAYRRWEAEVGADRMPGVEQRVMLHVLDLCWREHLAVMTDLLAGIVMRTRGEAAVTEYRREGALAFARMRDAASRDVASYLFSRKTPKPAPG